MNKQHKEVLEEYLVKKEKLLTHFKKYERAFPARDIKDLSNRTKALRYAIDILGRVEKLKKRELSGRYGDPSFQQQQNIGFNECVAYLKGE